MTLTTAEAREALQLIAARLDTLHHPINFSDLGRFKELVFRVADGDQHALAALRKTAPEVKRSPTAAIPRRYDPDTDTLIPSPRDTPELYPPERRP